MEELHVSATVRNDPIYAAIAPAKPARGPLAPPPAARQSRVPVQCAGGQRGEWGARVTFASAIIGCLVLYVKESYTRIDSR